jgi:DNA mismatch repair protein PMS2
MEIQATSRLEENISTVFGSKFLNNLTSIDLKMKLQSNQIKTKTTHSNSSDQTEHENNNDHKPVDSLFQSFLNFESNENDSINNNNDLAALNDAQCDDTIQYDDCHIVGYVSKINLGVGRSDNDRQYVYCNGRPVDMPRISKALNEVMNALIF